MASKRPRTLHVVLGLALIGAGGLYVALVRAPRLPGQVWIQALSVKGDRTTYGALARESPGGAIVRGHRPSFTLCEDEASDIVFLHEEATALPTLLALLVRSPRMHAYERAGPPRDSGGSNWLPFEAREPPAR